jgi:rhodanese-related sulfurtransferase
MDQPHAVEQIGPEVAVRLLAQGATMIDVREPDEWKLGRAPQSLHIPLGDLDARLSELPTDRKLIMTCRSGGRSNTAAAALVDKGLNALNLAGGMKAWKAASLPVVADGGVAGDVA